MRVIKFILPIFAFVILLQGQDTPVILESNALNHNSIELNWNVWDPADSYFDAILYISEITEINNDSIKINFHLENEVFISGFNLSFETDIPLSNVNLSGGTASENGFELTYTEGNLGNFTVQGVNTGENIPNSNDVFFQLTGNFNPDHGDESRFEINQTDTYLLDQNENTISLKYKNVIWDVGVGIASDECGDDICTTNENYSICPEECELDVTYSIYYENNPQPLDEISEKEYVMQGLIPNTEYCFEVVATENFSGVNETSNVACSQTNCIEYTWCQDSDGDGYGNPDIVEISCQNVQDYVLDCDDVNDNEYCLPNIFDFCGNCAINGIPENVCPNEENPSYPGLCICTEEQGEQCWTGVDFDCNGNCFGSADLDLCGVCTGGNTFITPNSTMDCNGTCAPLDPESVEINCEEGFGFNPDSLGCQQFWGTGSGIDNCGICGGNNSACFPYFEGPSNLLAQATNLQIGLSWDPVELCDPYIFDCWGDGGPILHDDNIEDTQRDHEYLNAILSIDQIEDDGQGTVSFFVNLQADVDVYMVKLNLDIMDIYDTLSVFQDFPNLDDLTLNSTDCTGGGCVQFGQPSGGVLESDDYNFFAFTNAYGSVSMQSTTNSFIENEILQDGTTIFRMDATYDPVALAGKELFITQTLVYNSENDTMVVYQEDYVKANTRFNTSVWQVGFGLASIYSCGDGICQEPFEESGTDNLSPSLDTAENYTCNQIDVDQLLCYGDDCCEFPGDIIPNPTYNQIVPDGFPHSCSTGASEFFLGFEIIGDCIPEQFCGDDICQELSVGGYTDGAPHEYPAEDWENCSLDCQSCGNNICDWGNNESYCDDIDGNSVPECSQSPIEYLSCSEDTYYLDIESTGDCMEPLDVEYIVYRDNLNYVNEESCLASNGKWLDGCFTPLATTTNTQFNDVGLSYSEYHCYYIEARQGALTTTQSQNPTPSCDTTNPQIGELPVIRRIDDMPNDQGGYVKLTVQRSYSDNGTVDSLYQVYRRFEDVNWSHVGSFPGTGEPSYFFISPTLQDSVPGNPNNHEFKVYYRGYIDSSAFSNFPEMGYSIDNIAPETPTNVDVNLGIDNINISWNPVYESDFSHYSIYRNNTLINNTTSISFVDENHLDGSGFNFGVLLQYQIGANDIHGNESVLSDVEMTSYGTLGNVTFQDIFLFNDNVSPNPLADSTLIDILDITMAQAVVCSKVESCAGSDNNALSNPTNYELWATDMNFNGEYNEKDLSCLVYYFQNDLVCPVENLSSINFNTNSASKSIDFSGNDIHRIEIFTETSNKVKNHNLPNNWTMMKKNNSIVFYSLSPKTFSGNVYIEFENPSIISSVKTYTYKNNK